jgi:hypothetical protein
MRTAGWPRPVLVVVLFMGIVAGCAAPASWVHRPIAEPPDAGAADAERCEADARVIARPWRASPSVAGWLALDLSLLAAEILSATPTKEVAIALGATTLRRHDLRDRPRLDGAFRVLALVRRALDDQLGLGVGCRDLPASAAPFPARRKGAQTV